MKIYQTMGNDDYVDLWQISPDPDRRNPILWFNEVRPLAREWMPVEVELMWYSERDKSHQHRLKDADFPDGGLGCLVMGRRARDSLQGYLAAFGELLPLLCSERELWAFNVLKMVDALDPSRSSPLHAHYSLAPPFEPIGQAIGIGPPYAFHIDRLQDADLFKVPQLRGFFMTEKFKEKVESLGLTGLTLRCEFDSVADRNGFDWLGRPRPL